MVLYYPNESVSTVYGDVGRVLYHNDSSHMVYILIRTNDSTWVMQKYDESQIFRQEKLIWGMEVPFRSKFVSRIHYERSFIF
jgi:hypothetical protein